MSTCWTKVNHSLFFSLSLSFLFLVTLTLTFLGRFLTPDDQMNWLSLVSILTSSVLIILLTSFLISEMALGAFLLNWILCVSLWMLTVVSKAVSVRAFLSTCLPIVVKQQLNIDEYKIQILKVISLLLILMYPNLDNDSDGNQSQQRFSEPKKKQGISVEIQNAIIDIKDKFQMQSIKPLFGSYQIIIQITAKSSPVKPIPIKVLFFPNYPLTPPRLYVSQSLTHPLINPINGEIKYQSLLTWTPKTKFIDLLQKIQANFNTSDVKQDPFVTYVADYKQKLQQYAKEINKLSNINIPANPPEHFLSTLKLPAAPVFNFDSLKKQKQYLSNLKSEFEDNVAIYDTLVIDYNENKSKAVYISDRFGKGKILKQMESAMERCEPDISIEGVEAQLADFHAKRKQYHRMEILKQKYLDN